MVQVFFNVKEFQWAKIKLFNSLVNNWYIHVHALVYSETLKCLKPEFFILQQWQKNQVVLGVNVKLI